MAGQGIADQSVLYSVGGIALVQNRTVQNSQLLPGKNRLAVWSEIDVRSPLGMKGILRAQVHRRRSGDDAVEIIRKAFGLHHRFATALGTAVEVGVLRCLPGVLLDESFCRQDSH